MLKEIRFLLEQLVQAYFLPFIKGAKVLRASGRAA